MLTGTTLENLNTRQAKTEVVTLRGLGGKMWMAERLEGECRSRPKSLSAS